MDVPVEERQPFHHVTCNMSSALDDVTVPGALALDVVQQVKNWFLFRVFIGLVK
jgi:protein regulator of cytokinesis 1